MKKVMILVKISRRREGIYENRHIDVSIFESENFHDNVMECFCILQNGEGKQRGEIQI